MIAWRDPLLVYTTLATRSAHLALVLIGCRQQQPKERNLPLFEGALHSITTEPKAMPMLAFLCSLTRPTTLTLHACFSKSSLLRTTSGPSIPTRGLCPLHSATCSMTSSCWHLDHLETIRMRSIAIK